MIINASTTFTLLLLRIGQTCQVTIVIITPHQRYVIWHLEAAFHNLQHLLIRNEYLGHLFHLFVVELAQELALIINDLLQAS